MGETVQQPVALDAELADRVLEALPFGVLVVDPARRPLYANTSSAVVLGAPAALAPSARDGAVHPAIDAALSDALAGRRSRTVASEVTTPQGVVACLEVIAAPVLDDDGSVTHGVAVTSDVSARRVAERDSRLLAAIVDSADDAIISVDLDGVITSWNDGARRLYGYTADEAVGRPIDGLYVAGDAPVAALAAIRLGEHWTHADVVRRRSDGSSVTVAESFSPVVDADDTVVGAASISADVTLRRLVAEELATARRELEGKNRRLERSNAELEQFAYIASHDLSEPLRAVAGMVQLLAKRYRGQLDADADEFIDFATEGCERLRAMIDDLLAYSRVGSRDMAVAAVATADLVAGVVASLHTQIETTGATVRVAPLPTVQGDDGQLRQVFQNLLSNAIKFGRPGVPPTVDVTAARTPDGWAFSVADDGIGIESQYRQRIFRMFQRLHVRDAYPGNGIGLAIAERIVDRHGGRIGVRDTPGGGATFHFDIPDGGPEA